MGRPAQRTALAALVLLACCAARTNAAHSHARGPLTRRLLGDVEGHALDEGSSIAQSEWTIVVGMACLFLVFTGSRALEHLQFSYLPEAGLAVLLGMAASAITWRGQESLMIEDMRFDFEFFMIWLLPPIIFEAGYNMNRRAFFENLLPTTLFAFGGTLISMAVVGGLVFGAGQAGMCHALSGLSALYFGALISATDPVTVLAVFQKLGVKSDLFSMVFGESVMNDAVAIVLSRTLLAFKTEDVTAQSLGLALLVFLEIFVGSLLIGVIYGILSSLVYKHMHMKNHDDALYLETAMIVTFAWGANYTAEALNLSGIVAILFCGIVMAKYTRDNLSEGARMLSARTFKVVALLAESFVFVYLGMAAFSYPIFHNTTWRLVLIALPACLLGRTQIYLFANLVNAWRRLRLHAQARPNGWCACLALKKNAQIPPQISFVYQHVMVFSGLRGGVAFAIAAVGYSHDDFHSNEDSLAIMQVCRRNLFIKNIIANGAQFLFGIAAHTRTMIFTAMKIF